MGWLKNAFAVDGPGPAEPSAEQREVVDRVCREVVRRQLVAPALMFLEMSRPLNFLGSQAMHFFTPIISALADTQQYQHLAAFLERRGSIEFMSRRIEQIEDERAASAKPQAAGEAKTHTSLEAKTQATSQAKPLH